MSDGRSPAEIEADIVRRRQQLAAALDEIAVRVHPRTIVGEAKAKAVGAVDRTAGRAYVAANKAVSRGRSKSVSPSAPGEPRDAVPSEEGGGRGRAVPLAVAGAVVVVGVVAVLAVRRRRGRR